LPNDAGAHVGLGAALVARAGGPESLAATAASEAATAASRGGADGAAAAASGGDHSATAAPMALFDAAVALEPDSFDAKCVLSAPVALSVSFALVRATSHLRSSCPPRPAAQIFCIVSRRRCMPHLGPSWVGACRIRATVDGHGDGWPK